MTVTAHGTSYGDMYARPYTPGMARRRIVGAQQVRENFSEHLDAAEKRSEHTIVFRRSRPSGILVDPEWYHRASEALGEPWDDWTPPKPDA